MCTVALNLPLCKLLPSLCGHVLQCLLVTSSPKGLSLVGDPPSSPSVGEHNPSETYRSECWGPFPCPVCVSGSCASPALSLVSAVLFSVPQSLCRIYNKNASDVCDVNSRLAPHLGRKGAGGLSNSAHRDFPLLRAGASSRGRLLPKVGPFSAAQAILACPACLPLPLWVESQ